MSRLAIIGTGIAGLGCAHFLHREYELTLFEQHDYAGGHTNTVTAIEPGTGRTVPIDTGFMVFNHVTYPLLSRLFEELQVPIKPTAMSFAVRDDVTGLEWCGSSLRHLFAQRRNLFNPRFLRMLAKIDRFNREAVATLQQPMDTSLTIRDYARRQGYGDDFLRLYLLPMAGAVWSAEGPSLEDFPAITVLRFFHNHGFLGLHTQHPWLTVDGGAREYRDRLIAPWRHCIALNRRAVQVSRPRQGGVRVRTADGREESFDHVIIATHADQALALLEDPTPDEARLLQPFRYQTNIATLHTDPAVMPRTRRAWSSWNVQLTADRGIDRTATHYWMNRLQDVSPRENYFVSINRPHAIDPARVLRRIEYAHPLFTRETLRAQPELPTLNARATGTTETYLAGSYFRYGFHEDAFASAVHLCQHLLQRNPWHSATPPTLAPAPAVVAA